VGGEEEFADVEFCDDAADGPDVAEFIPLAALQDYFWRTVLSRVDDGAVPFCSFGRSPEVDDLDPLLHRQVVFLSFAVGHLLEFFALEQYVFWF
jgi:hypothetical protein